MASSCSWLPEETNRWNPQVADAPFSSDFPMIIQYQSYVSRSYLTHSYPIHIPFISHFHLTIPSYKNRCFFMVPWIPFNQWSSQLSCCHFRIFFRSNHPIPCWKFPPMVFPWWKTPRVAWLPVAGRAGRLFVGLQGAGMVPGDDQSRLGIPDLQELELCSRSMRSPGAVVAKFIAMNLWIYESMYMFESIIGIFFAKKSMLYHCGKFMTYEGYSILYSYLYLVICQIRGIWAYIRGIWGSTFHIPNIHLPAYCACCRWLD